MMQLNQLEKITKKRKRVGRGGDHGGTSGRGHKGQKARSGGKVKASFEGGQMPLSRRIPKRGFNNIFKKEVVIINLEALEHHFDANAVVDRTSLFTKGVVKGKSNFFIKILGKGSLSKALDVRADFFSASAREAIEKAGGKVQSGEEIGRDRTAS